MRDLLRALAAVAAICFAVPGWAQTQVYQTGAVTAGHAGAWQGDGSLGDAGSITHPSANSPITDLPVVGVGTPSCVYDVNPFTSSVGYHYTCLGANSSGAHVLSFGAGGSATSIPADINVYGTTVAAMTSSGIGLLGTPTAPTQVGSDSSTKIATTAYVQAAIGGTGVATLPWVQTNSALASLSALTNSRAIRGGTTAAGDAPFQGFVAQSGTCTAAGFSSDIGHCVNDGTGNSWLSSLPIVDGREFGIPAHGSNGTTQAQAALDAATKTGVPTLVYFPNSFDFTSLAIYPGLTLQCGGFTRPLYRTLSGPGIYGTDAVGHGYPAGEPGYYGTIRDCHVESSGLAGSGITLPYNIYSSNWYNVSSTGTDTAATLLMGTITGSVLTVNQHPTGVNPSVGMLLVCAGCGTTTNSYVTITGGADPTWSITPAVTNPVPLTGTTPQPIIAVSPWTWSATGGGGNNTIFPSANVSILGANQMGWYNGFLGVMTNGGTCPSGRSGIGLYMDSAQTNGSGAKPNNNVFSNVNDICSLLGLLLANGSDNNFIAGEHQNDLVAAMIGVGVANAQNNQFQNTYFENGNDLNGFAGWVFGQAGTSNTIWGVGSLGTINAAPYPLVIDYQCPVNNSGCSSRNKIILDNYQTWVSTAPVTTFYQGLLFNNTPPTPNQDSYVLDADDTHSPEYVAWSYQNGSIPMFNGIAQQGAHGSQAAVSADFPLAIFGGRGQYDTTRGHVCGFGSGLTFGTKPCGYMQVTAKGGFSGAAYPTRLDFFTTDFAATTAARRFGIGLGLFADGLSDSGAGKVNALDLQVSGVSAFTGFSGTSSSIGGGALLAGNCATGTATVTGARSTMAVIASTSADPGNGVMPPKAWVSSNDTVTIDVCVAVDATPTALTYKVRVIQ